MKGKWTIGPHISADDFIKNPGEYAIRYGAVQCFPSSPMAVTKDENGKIGPRNSVLLSLAQALLDARKINSSFQLHLHAPFWSSLTPKSKTNGITKEYLTNLAKAISSMDWEPIITVHPGRLLNGVLDLGGLEILDGTKLTVALETMPYRKDTIDLVKLTNALDTIKYRYLNVGICFDTEHSFASGLSLNYFMDKNFRRYVKVLHLNGIPNKVKFGMGLDRHSQITLAQSADDSDMFKKDIVRQLLRCFAAATHMGIPTIIECDAPYVADNISQINIDNIKVCPSCEKMFECDAENMDAEACWCFKKPVKMIPEELRGRGCLCESCLDKLENI